MAQAASFFYYNPESGSDSRQHDLFTPQPNAILKSSPLALQDAGMQPLYTPALSRPIAQKPGMASHEPHVLSVETELGLYDDFSYPRTPGLSTTSSAVSSPPHSSYLPTPTNSFFESLAGVKEGCEHDVKSEILGGWDFSRSSSPPLTPVFVNPPNVTANSAVGSQVSELLSTSSCPSLSPSPSPAPQQHLALQHAENFCDPRNLLVNTKSTPLINQLEIPTLPAFIPSNDDLLIGCGVAAKSEPNGTLEPLPPVVDSVPFFDSFSDLDSETDFITDLSQENTSLYAGVKRQRMDSIPFSEDLSESSFDDDDWMSLPDSCSDKHLAKKQKMDESVDFEFGSSLATTGASEASTAPVSGSDSKDAAAIAPATDTAGTPSSAQQSSASANRRGRKQSLTDDPSKTFVCTLCSRRFRRQEHLKRHYRSLHTQDKPFECTDCGKKFSRSDNLAQHARTHGNTTTIVGLTMPEMDEKTASMGVNLFAAVAAVSSSSSSSGSSNGGNSDDEKAAAKKRKRDE